MSDYPSHHRKPLAGQLELPIFGRGQERPATRKDAPAADAARPLGVVDHLGDLDAAASDVSISCDPQERRSGAIVASPRTSITGAQSSHPALGGLDWVAGSAQLRWTCDFADLWGRLLAARADRREGGDGIFKLPNGSLCQIRDKGATCGIVRCEIAIDMRGVVILLEGRDIPIDDRPNAFIRVEGSACLTTGGRIAFADALAVLESLGAEIVSVAPSRVDFCVDMPGQKVDPFISAWMGDQLITRANRQAIHREKRSFTGLEIGKGGDVMCRVYDKAVEAKDEEKRKAMIALRWGGEDQEHAARVEFQVQRDTLRKKFDVKTMEDLWERLPQIVEWLCFDWLRFTSNSVDYENKHQSRATTCELWAAIQSRFIEVFGRAETWLPPALPPCPAPFRLWRQAFGCIASAVARSCDELHHIDEFLDLVRIELRAVAEEIADELLHKIHRKAAVQKARSAYHALEKVPIPF